MATYNFSPVPAWGQAGSFARIGAKKSTTFPCTLPGGGSATVVQGGTTKVGYVESDANGLIPAFTTTDIPSVDINFGVAVLRVNSAEAITSGASSAAAAASSATDAANSASAAAASASDAAATVAGKVDKGSLVVNVKDYGAKGDGTTDDTTAFTNAISAAVTAKLPLYIPGGHYKITGTLDIPDGLVVYGAGSEPVNGTPTRLNFSTLTGTIPAITIVDGSSIVLRDFYVTGRTSGSGNEVQISGQCRSVTVERVTVNTSTTGAAVAIAAIGGASHYLLTSRFSAVKTVGGTYGFQLGNSSTSITFDACYAMNATTAGYLIQGTYCNLLSCASDTSGLYGYLLQGCVGIGLYGCGSEQSGRTGFHLSGATGITSISCRTVGSNTLADAVRPSFMALNDASDNVTVLSPTDTTPNAAAPYSINSWQGTVPTAATFLNAGGLAKGIQPALVNRITVNTLRLAAGVAANAPLRIPHGVAPTSPVDGDLWTTSAGMFVRVNGVTKTVTLT